jgi:esterase/lipase/1-acyl-sn-glycerol-3-phosphate acyltransferase
MSSTAYQLTKWSLHLATRLIKADARVLNAEAIEDDMSIIFVVNHFTRIETILLPYMLQKETGQPIWSLAAGELFVGRVGDYLRSMGTVATSDPDRDKTIIRSLLSGENSWVIFPEGAMIKDKKVVDSHGTFKVFSKGKRRAPHTGPAVMALRAEYYRNRLACLCGEAGDTELEGVLANFGLETCEEALAKRTVIIPVNVTYFPIRSRDNVVLRMARKVAKDLSPRALEELSVEGTVLSRDTDIDITLGAPIDVRDYLEAPEFEGMLNCSDVDMEAMEKDPKSPFTEAARRLMYRYMADIYRMTTVNYDHLFATIIRHQRSKKFGERNYRNRIFLSAHRMQDLGHHRVHGVLRKTYRNLVYDEANLKLDNFIQLCLSEGILLREGERYIKNTAIPRGKTMFHKIRRKEITYVIANEIEPLTILTDLIKDVAQMPKDAVTERIRAIFLEEDRRIFDEDYEAYYKEDESKTKDVGAPFLLLPKGKMKGGVVLTHGYLAAPLEIRALAEHLHARGYAVYAPRLRGHGTSPEDLARTPWESWYESLNRGYAIMRTYTDAIFLGGFSTGGVMSLIGAGRKGSNIRGVFAINAPLALQSYGALFAPTIVSMNSLIRWVKRSHDRWEFVANNPENPHINYNRNPLTGVAELGEAMDALRENLSAIRVPTFIMQGSRDTVVKPSSGQKIFDLIGTPHKELCVLERERHGIVNGAGSEDVFERIHHFLQQAKTHDPAPLELEGNSSGPCAPGLA